MRARAVALVLALMVVGGCTRSSQEAVPFEGRWKSIGFGSYLVIEGGDVDVYEHTSLSCGLTLEGAADGISEVASIDEDERLVIDDGGRVVRYEAVDDLPAACGRPFESDDPARTFEVLVATFDDHYAFLDARAPDWERRSSEIAAGVTSESSGAELFQAVADLLRPLGDAQVRLITDDDGLLPEGRVWGSVETPPAVAALREDIRSGLVLAEELEVLAGGDVVTGILAGGAGYLGITSFAGIDQDLEEAESALAAAVDRLLGEIGRQAGLIVDLRANPGGFRDQALLVASRFVPTERLVVRYEARIGGTEQYVDAGRAFVRPMPTGVHQGEVVVLAGPGTIGAAEVLVLALRGLDGVTVIGEDTAGSIAPLLARTMPNGWAVGLANTRVFDADGAAWDVTGIPPDEVVPLTVEDVEGGRDPGLERAERLLDG